MTRKGHPTDLELTTASHAFGDLFGHVFHTPVSFVAPFLVEGTERSFQADLVRDDIGSTVGDDFPERKHSGSEGLAKRLTICCKATRICAVIITGSMFQVGHCPMSAFAVYGNIQFIRAGHVETFPETDFAGWDLRHHVLTNDRSGFRILQNALLDHE